MYSQFTMHGQKKKHQVTYRAGVAFKNLGSVDIIVV